MQLGLPSRLALVFVPLLLACGESSCIGGPNCGDDPASAPTFTVSGFVRYSATRLDGIRVELIPDSLETPPAQSATTANGGTFAFSGVTAGSYFAKVYGREGDIGWTASGFFVTNNDVVLELFVLRDVKLLTPADSSTVTTTPITLTWQSVPEAVSYRVQLILTSNLAIIEEAFPNASSYTIGGAVSPGVSYTWRVVNAVDSQGRFIGGSQRSFTFTAG